MSNKYYNPAYLHLSGREYEVLMEYPDGTKLICFPDFGNEKVLAKSEELDGTYKEKCEKEWGLERNRIARVHGWNHAEKEREEIPCCLMKIIRDCLTEMYDESSVADRIIHRLSEDCGCSGECTMENGCQLFSRVRELLENESEEMEGSKRLVQELDKRMLEWLLGQAF